VNLEVFLEKIFVSRALATLQGKHLNRSSTKLRAQEKLASACLQVPKIPSRRSVKSFDPRVFLFVWHFRFVVARKDARFQKPLNPNPLFG
jgi:hypothetical protein